VPYASCSPPPNVAANLPVVNAARHAATSRSFAWHFPVFKVRGAFIETGKDIAHARAKIDNLPFDAKYLAGIGTSTLAST